MVALSQVLMEILGRGQPRGRGENSPAEIAFVDGGMEATSRSTRTTTRLRRLRGVLTYVSADTPWSRSRDKAPILQVQGDDRWLQVLQHRGRGLAILPMTALVEIKTGTGTVFDYLAKPVVTVSGSFSDQWQHKITSFGKNSETTYFLLTYIILLLRSA